MSPRLGRHDDVWFSISSLGARREYLEDPNSSLFGLSEPSQLLYQQVGAIRHQRQSAFDRLSDTYSPSTTKSHPQRMDSRDSPRGRGQTRTLSTPRDDRHKDRECLRGTRESYGDSFSHSYRDEDHHRHMKRKRDKSPPSSVSRSDSSNGRHRKSTRHHPMEEDDLKNRGCANKKIHSRLESAAAAQVERWAMPTWCHMFNSTLIGAARKKYVKDPMEIHNIKQRDGKTIEDFMERFKIETRRMKGTPECMRIFRFMNGVNNPELTKRLNEHVPKTMEEMMITIIAFIQGEAAAASKKKGHASWKPQDQSKRHSLDKRPDFRAEEADRGVSTAGKLSHLIKEIKQGRDQSKTGKKETAAKDKPTKIYMVQSWQRTVKQKVTQIFEREREIAFPQLTTSNGTEGPLVIEAKMGGHVIHRMYINGGSSIEILYEHCFNRLRLETNSQMVPATTSLTGFSGETIWPLGQLRLLVTIGDATHSTKAWMNFMVVKSMSPYNGIIGRLGLKAIQAVPSTVHGMLKFPVEGGIVTIRSTILIPTECASVTTSSVTPREERTNTANFTVALHHDFPDQEVGYTPVRQKKKGQAPERARDIQAKVQKLVDVGIMREVYYHDWLSNPVMVKKHDGSWRMCVDFTDLNRACPQDCYPLSEIDWKRLMDKAFESQVGQNIEVYVDDLVVKSHTEAEMVRDIEETFRTLRKVNIKLNPKKCSFELAEGVFLGKISATVSDLKKCIKKSDFRWTAKAEQEFQQLKQHLSELPLLVAPKPQEELIMYLSATYEAVSVVLMMKKGTTQTPIYFISRALQGNDSSRRGRAAVKVEHYAGRAQYYIQTEDVGAGLILTNPEGVEFTYALRFQFAASNNEAKYEALERRERVAVCEAMAKSKMMKYYNVRVRDVAFKPGDFVYHSNDASHAVAGGKLGPKWEGIYEVTEALGNRAYKLRSTDGTSKTLGDHHRHRHQDAIRPGVVCRANLVSTDYYAVFLLLLRTTYVCCNSIRQFHFLFISPRVSGVTYLRVHEDGKLRGARAEVAYILWGILPSIALQAFTNTLGNPRGHNISKRLPHVQRFTALHHGKAHLMSYDPPVACDGCTTTVSTVDTTVKAVDTVVMPKDALVGVSDPDPLSFADAPSRHPVDVAQSSPIAAAGDPESENASSPAEVGSPGSVYQPKWGVTNVSLLDTPEACQTWWTMPLPRATFPSYATCVATLQEQVSGEENLKAAFEEFKRWVIRHGLRLAVMKCGESLDMRQAFADVVSVGITKGMSEGLRHKVEHGQAQLDVESIEAYDPKAEAKFIAALQALKDLKYHLLDQLEGLKDTPIDVIIASLYLKSDTGEDAPQYIRDLRPSSSQLTIPVYPGVRDPQNPWAYKEEMKLADAITANISCAKKKKKCRIVCRTHGLGSVHHARSDGVLLFVPTVVPYGLALLLADAATQTEFDDT
nr:hypothetical protein [Tanacetum cinerariifolium]